MKFAHLNIKVKDIEKSMSFYQEFLGFTCYSQNETDV